MTKFKTFFQNKLNILIISIVAVVVIAVPLTITLMNKNKPVEVAQAPSSAPTSSEETVKPKVNVPEIKVDKPVSSEVSSVTSSKEIVKVDKDTTSKPVVEKKPTASTKAKPVSPKPTQPKNNDGIDAETQKILDELGATTGPITISGDSGQTKAGTDDGGYN